MTKELSLRKGFLFTDLFIGVDFYKDLSVVVKANPLYWLKLFINHFVPT